MLGIISNVYNTYSFYSIRYLKLIFTVKSI